MRTLDKIKLIRASVNCTYDEARRALVSSAGNIPQAIKYIEDKYTRKALIYAFLFIALSYFGLVQLDKVVMAKTEVHNESK